MPGRYALLLLCLAAAAPAGAATRVMVTGEWPPYTGVAEVEGGTMTATVRAAYAAVGDELRVGFFAWARIRRLLMDNPDVTGSFPHYYSEERASRCHFSDPIGSSPLGLVSRLNGNLRWERLEDLDRYRIGTVKSYSHTLAFDRLVAEGRMRTVAAATDADNLRNLLAGKVDAVIIDRNVFAYLLMRAPLREQAAQMRLDPRMLVVHRLYACFPKSPAGRAARDRFNEGLRTLLAPLPPAS